MALDWTPVPTPARWCDACHSPIPSETGIETAHVPVAAYLLPLPPTHASAELVCRGGVQDDVKKSATSNDADALLVCVRVSLQCGPRFQKPLGPRPSTHLIPSLLLPAPLYRLAPRSLLQGAGQVCLARGGVHTVMCEVTRRVVVRLGCGVSAKPTPTLVTGETTQDIPWPSTRRPKRTQRDDDVDQVCAHACARGCGVRVVTQRRRTAKPRVCQCISTRGVVRLCVRFAVLSQVAADLRGPGESGTRRQVKRRKTAPQSQWEDITGVAPPTRDDTDEAMQLYTTRGSAKRSAPTPTEDVDMRQGSSNKRGRRHRQP